MTNETIIKSLWCCSNNNCDGCPLVQYADCMVRARREAVSLIERQGIEIEQLKETLATKTPLEQPDTNTDDSYIAEIRRLIAERDEARRDCAVAERNYQRVREDAVNEFAEKLLFLFPYERRDFTAISKGDIRAIVKEMIGGY